MYTITFAAADFNGQKAMYCGELSPENSSTYVAQSDVAQCYRLFIAVGVTDN